MNTAQMTQAMPRMVNDVNPPAGASSNSQQATSSTEIEIINDIPVQKASLQKSTGFNPIMATEYHDPGKPAISDQVLHDASHAVHSAPTMPETKKGLFGKKSVMTKPAYKEPKPILETVLLIVGCLVACAIVIVMFSAS